MPILSAHRKVTYNEWIGAGILLGLFFLLRGYLFGWYDHHLEIPLLKRLIDPTLYPRDYYVQSLPEHFTTFFYLILSRFITIDQIQPVYFVLFLICRFFLFYWMLKIWDLLSKGNKAAAWAAVAFPTLFGFTPEFMYPDLSHQEFTMPFVFAGLYFFLAGRYFLSALILGIGTNFHALYCLFPMFYMCLFLFFEFKKKSFQTLSKVLLIYLSAASPFIIWSLSVRILSVMNTQPVGITNILRLYKNVIWNALIFEGHPLSYLTKNFLGWLFFARDYLLILSLLGFLLIHNPSFRRNKKVLSICFGSIFLFVVAYLFTYHFPSGFFINLNLTRNTQYLFFFLIGYFILFADVFLKSHNDLYSFTIIFVLLILLYDKIIGALALLFLTFFLLFYRYTKFPHLQKKQIFLLVPLAVTFLAICIGIVNFSQEGLFILFLWFVVYGFLSIGLRLSQRKQNSNLVILGVLFFFYFCIAIISHYQQSYQIKNAKSGFWKLQRDWIDMQNYAKSHTPKNALFLVPYDMTMGGFRIFSERSVVFSYRDAGIIAFDLDAMAKWLQRRKDLADFRVTIPRGTDLRDDLKNALYKYYVDYIVFMKYASPHSKSQKVLKKVYENDSFTLFHVAQNLFPRKPRYFR